MMGFTKQNRERGVTSGEMIGCCRASSEGEDVEVVENLEALAGLTGDNEGILRAAIDYIASRETRISSLSAQVERMKGALERIAALRQDKCEFADTETLLMLLDNKVGLARAALAENHSPGLKTDNS